MAPISSYPIVCFASRPEATYLIDPWLWRRNCTASNPQLLDKLRLTENHLAKPECAGDFEETVCKTSISLLDQAGASYHEAVVLTKNGPRAVSS